VVPSSFVATEVAAAAAREQLDDLRVGRTDQEDGEHHGHRQVQCEVGMRSEGEERLLGTVGRGRQSVGTQSHPGEERDQRELVMDLGVEEVLPTAEDEAAQSF
jgi:hypothetical protein